MEHKIKPHKGGRTERVSGRLTPEVKKKLDRILQKQGINFSDFVEQQVNEAEKK